MTTGLNNDGHLDIIASNVTLTAGERLFNMASHVDFEDAVTMQLCWLQQSYLILLYQNQGDGTFVDVTSNLSCLDRWSTCW